MAQNLTGSGQGPEAWGRQGLPAPGGPGHEEESMNRGLNF